MQELIENIQKILSENEESGRKAKIPKLTSADSSASFFNSAPSWKRRCDFFLLKH